MRMSAELSRLLVMMHAHTRGGGEVPQVNGERVERALERMREGVAEELSLADFAKAAGVSVPHFCVLFKTRTGVPPMLYFTRLRMRHAAELLDSSEATVEEIGSRVGYENPFHFSRAFRRTQGMSPRAYRKRVRG
jgi:transcriptional regulator GlxA family with amidase domain